MDKGYLALVLHAHLPYVHHPESETVMEEKWLFEALTESYLPLLDVYEGLVRDGVPFKLTMSLTPTLLSMLASPLLQERYALHLDSTVELAEKEMVRTRGDGQRHKLARMYAGKLHRYRRKFAEQYRGNVIGGFRKLMESGHLELVTSSATHAFLPYVRTEQAIRAQLAEAVAVHERHLGVAPRGIWLPECGYTEGLDRLLAEYGLRYFFTDSHAVKHAYPKPENGVYAPLFTPHGVAVFARDQEASKQVWSAQEGYPGDHDYREFYRDIGYELDYDYLRPHLHKSGLRLDTGLKYFRITGDGERKELYEPEWALRKAELHAGNFMFNRERQAEHLAAHMPRKPIIVASYDAELFGHWWYEGPAWLDFLCRKIAGEQQTIRLVTPADYVAEYPAGETGQPPFSSWGRGGYGEVWLGESNEWMYRHLHLMEEEMIRLADLFPNAGGLRRRFLNQAARELMLAESSDWAFIMDNRTVVEYAVRRFCEHAGRFRRLAEAVRGGTLDESWLAEVERRDDIFPQLDYRRYGTPGAALVSASASARAVQAEEGDRADGVPAAESAGGGMAGENSKAGAASRTTAETIPGRRSPPVFPLKVLMLSWEFPPMIVGGLSRHVYELARKLAARGLEVHVVTCHVDGYPAYEVNEGVRVHRVKPYQAQTVDFMGWVFQLNLAMVDYARNLAKHHVAFDIIHAHDWLVSQAAQTLKHRLNVPLVATIHATEHGRNQGLFTPLQHDIHGLEWELTYEACRVIGCSLYMEDEIRRLFGLPEGKIDMIPNGVDSEAMKAGSLRSELRNRYALPHEKIVMFVGRLVREKGVQVLLDSIPLVTASCPDAKFVVAGKGPMLQTLERQAHAQGVDGRVAFAGFIEDSDRNELYAMSAAAVFPSLYEPFGIVALEAMAAGVPVIVSGTGGLQEIVRHGVDGLTALPGNAESLAAQIIRVLQDEGGAGALASRGLHKVRTQYDWSSIAERTIDCYGKAAAASQNGAAAGMMETAASQAAPFVLHN
ncbi:1,4-alpha-glucan branching protein domain-containing protein [Paenibacillus sp. MBLB4367]|uniref:1,4-alpha-glucan branching protein domain-containing protein n=1 Tax=Paenibacillus sp. MBLB4367 TaxID=3384767 RepID=UPI003907EE12